MTDLPKSRPADIASTDSFFWACGIEDTFITAPWPATGRTLDEYELTGHYERFEQDIELMSEIGLRIVRYGIPWHRVQPGPDTWNWAFVDAALNKILDCGIEPIVDLVHYGLPPWIENAYLHPHYPDLVAEYAAQLADRFKGRLRFYTPLNEPRITAWYCGRLGWWPPYGRGWHGFVALTMAIARGIVRTVQRLHAVDPEIVPVHVDATDLYDTGDSDLREEAERRQEIVFLALDLVSGRVDPGHRLWKWLLQNGATEADLRWLEANAVALPLIGLNLYPMFSRKILRREARGRLRIRQPYASGHLVATLGRLYHARYQAPMFVSETASLGPVAKRQAWMDDSIQAVRLLRQEGIPMIGYTWWPMFDMIAWAYRQGNRYPAHYFAPMGLWNLDPVTLDRNPTSLVGSYRGYVAGGLAAVGPLSSGRA